MADLFGGARDLWGRATRTAGEFIAGVGYSAGLPEMGISERIVGPAYAAEPELPERAGRVTGVPSFQYGGGEVAGATTTGGGGGGTSQLEQYRQMAAEGHLNPIQMEEYQRMLEQAEGPPQIDFDALIAPALEALGQAEQAVRTMEEAEVGEAEAFRTGAVGKAETERAARERELGIQRTTEEATSEQAVAEQRRGFAEIQKGLGARYGAAVSTGLGAAGIVGAQTMRNIATIRAQLSEAISQIESTRQGVIDITNQAIREAEAQAATMKTRARANLQAALAEIGAKRGELQSRKMELVNQAMMNYRDYVAGINQRNTQFMQELYLQRDAAQATLEKALATAKDKVASYQYVQHGIDRTPMIFDPNTGQVMPVTVPGGIEATGGLFPEEEEE